jgi:anti-anti-sigma factor
VRLADLQVSVRDRVVIARMVGDIDMSNADDISVAVIDATPHDLLGVVLDFGEVTYLDSAGIHLIYRLRQSLRARGQALKLVIPRRSPAVDAIRLAGVERNLGVAEDVEQALRELQTD